MRQLNRNRTLAGLIPALLAGLVSAGCQQPSGQGTARPLLPANPMNGPTRIPPPPTGSIGGGNGYTQPIPTSGQVSNGLRVNDLVAAAQTPPASATAPVGSGVLAAGNAATDSRPVASSPVQQVGFESNSPRLASQTQRNAVATAGPLATPTIPADAMVAPSYVDAAMPFRPQLRGMQAIDLTPTAPPTLQPVDSGNWAVVDESQQGGAKAFPSTQPVQRAGSQDRSASSDSSAPRSASFNGTGAGSGANGSATDASLQWRRPQVAR